MSLFLFHPSTPPCPQELHHEQEVLAVRFGDCVSSDNDQDIPAESLIVPRYLGAGRSIIEEAAAAVDSQLINSYQEYKDISNVDNWRNVLSLSFTQKPHGDKKSLRRVQVGEMQQGVLHTRRAFVYHGELLTWGTCGTIFEQDVAIQSLDEAQYYHMLYTVIEQSSHIAPFYAINLVEKSDGSWAVTSLQDGCMSPLEGNDPAKVWISIADKVEQSVVV